MTKLNSTPTLYLAVPCFNEQEVLQETANRLQEKLGEMMVAGTISDHSRILFIDDGSKDATWEIIDSLHKSNSLVCGLKLSHNQGHQNALLAGLMTAKEYADCVISMDADLQDDISVLDKFIEKYNDGCDVVYGVRSSRKSDTAFKRKTAEGYYKFLSLLGVDIVYNHADYRLMSRRALDALAEYKEVNLFLRGIVRLIGFKTATVEYERHERFAGKSKYPFKKMLSFALDGITSFSVKPIKIIGNLGVVISILSIFAMLYAFISKLTGNAVAGWTAIVASIWLIGGIQLLSLGVIGTYVGKIYSETKARPKYIIEEFLEK